METLIKTKKVLWVTFVSHQNARTFVTNEKKKKKTKGNERRLVAAVFDFGKNNT